MHIVRLQKQKLLKIYPFKPNKLNNEEFILSLRNKDIKRICQNLHINNSINDLSEYLKNKQLENDTNSRNIEENTNPLLNMSNVYSEDYNWNIKYTMIEGLLGNSNKRRKERKELTKQWAKEFEQYPGWLIVPADFRQQVKSYTNGKELLQCSEKELESNFDYCNELLDFAYEYTRRYKKSCLPLDKNIENNLYKIWDTLNSHSDWKEKNKNKWFTVGLYLLENYRQNMDEEKWNSICDQLKPCTNFIVDGKYYLKLEEILMNLFKMDLEKVQLELVSCSLEEMPYEVRLRFIGVMTECGLNEEALKAVEELTNDIQKNNNEIAESSLQNVYLKSLLVCALYLKEHLLFCMNPYKEETRKKWNPLLWLDLRTIVGRHILFLKALNIVDFHYIFEVKVY